MSVKRGINGATRLGVSALKDSAAAAVGNGQTTFSEEDVRRMIAEAAYMRAARRGFAPGGEIGDWLAAEREIRGALEASRLGRQPSDGVVAEAWPRGGALVETPPADATAR